MGICTMCGYLSDDSIKEVHECNAAHVAVGKKSREMAKQELIKDGVIEIVDGKPKMK